jgi:hypothetical protein
LKPLFFALALAAVLSSTQASAKEATFCKSGPMRLDQAQGTTFTNDTTVFNCGNGLKATVPDLYKQGWEVVSLTIPVTSVLYTQAFTSILIAKD